MSRIMSRYLCLSRQIFDRRFLPAVPTLVTAMMASLMLVAPVGSLTTVSLQAAPFVQDDEDDSDIPERPNTEFLLPETTVAFMQIDNFRDLVEKLEASNGGQLWKDESLSPLINGLWDEARATYDSQAKEQVGLELDDLTSLPSGELTFAVIAPRRKNPEFIMIMELNEENQVLDRVLDRGREFIQEESGEDIGSETSEDGFTIESFSADDKQFKFFRHKNLVVACSSEDELNAFIDRWMGREVKKVRPLASNRKFATIMNRCRGNNDLQPEARFFVDPIAFAKSATRGDIASQATINALPLLGLDGLLAVGGSMLLTEEEFDSVVHGHVLLSNPRGAVFDMLAFKPTDYEPESWMPEDVTNYITTSWDFDKMLAELTKIIDSFQEEGVVDQFIENNINQELGLDFKEDVIGQINGRVTYTQWMQPPARLNSGVNMLAIGLRDPDKAREVINAIIERINRDADEPDLIETQYKGISIWCEPEERASRRQLRREEFRRQRRERNGEEDSIRVELNIQQPRPAFGIVGSTLIISPQSRKFLEHAIDTENGSFPSLRDNEGFNQIQSRMRRLLKNESPCMLFFQNPEESMKLLMDVVKTENTQQFLNQAASQNEIFSRFKQRIDDNPLPEFDAIKKYFVKSGGFATTDDTGYHFLFFSLKPDDELNQ